MTLALLAALPPSGCRRTLPERPLTLWVWEREEDLTRLEGNYEIAVLLLSVRATSDRIDVRPRYQPLRGARSSHPVGVVRIDMQGDNLEHIPVIASRIAELPKRSPLAGVQVDFDATASQRDWYRSLLEKTRRQLPESVELSITALASWCFDDRWMADLPVNEAVPMIFEMGPDAHAVRNRLERGDDFREPLCRKSIGLSLREPLYRIPSNRRLYVFSPQGWTAAHLKTAQTLRSAL